MACTRCEFLKCKEDSFIMPRTPKSTDGEAPKKRTRKTVTETENGTKAVKAAPKTAKPKVAKSEVVATPAVQPAPEAAENPIANQVLTMVSLQERIRIRAYELYLRRGGQGGSPEQDWFQAVAEVHGESVA